GAVIHRVPRSGRRKNDPVQQSHTKAKRCAAPERFHEPASRRAMQKKFVAYAHIIRRHNHRHPVRDEPDMAYKRLIQNVVNGLPVVAPPVRLARNFCSFSWCEVAHKTRLAPASLSRKRQSGTGFSLCSSLRSDIHADVILSAAENHGYIAPWITARAKTQLRVSKNRLIVRSKLLAPASLHPAPRETRYIPVAAHNRTLDPRDNRRFRR